MLELELELDAYSILNYKETHKTMTESNLKCYKTFMINSKPSGLWKSNYTKMIMINLLFDINPVIVKEIVHANFELRRPQLEMSLAEISKFG